MRSRAWAWLIALVSLILAVIPLAAMSGIFGAHPMSLATANVLWIGAFVLAIVSLGMSIRQAARTIHD